MSGVKAFKRQKFENGTVEISAVQSGADNYVRISLNHFNGKSLISVCSLNYEKKYIESAIAVVEKLTPADFERAYKRLLDERKKILDEE